MGVWLWPLLPLLALRSRLRLPRSRDWEEDYTAGRRLHGGFPPGFLPACSGGLRIRRLSRQSIRTAHFRPYRYTNRSGTLTSAEARNLPLRRCRTTRRFPRRQIIWNLPRENFSSTEFGSRKQLLLYVQRSSFLNLCYGSSLEGSISAFRLQPWCNPENCVLDLEAE